MAKKRIHEWAKEMGVVSSEIMKFLPQIGVEAKTHFASLEEADVAKVRAHFNKKDEPKRVEVKQEVKKTEEIGRASCRERV